MLVTSLAPIALFFGQTPCWYSLRSAGTAGGLSRDVSLWPTNSDFGSIGMDWVLLDLI
jgi:hypothetical protein